MSDTIRPHITGKTALPLEYAVTLSKIGICSFKLIIGKFKNTTRAQFLERICSHLQTTSRNVQCCLRHNFINHLGWLHEGLSVNVAIKTHEFGLFEKTHTSLQ